MHVTTIIYRLAVALWLGGASLFTFVLTPALFRSESRDVAARIVGILFPGYFRWGVACGVVSLICLAIVRGKGWPVVAVVLAAMLTLSCFQAFYVEPRAAQLKREIVSFEQTDKNHPLRREFAKLHGISAVCNLTVIAGGVALVALF